MSIGNLQPPCQLWLFDPALNSRGCVSSWWKLMLPPYRTKAMFRRHDPGNHGGVSGLLLLVSYFYYFGLHMHSLQLNWLHVVFLCSHWYFVYCSGEMLTRCLKPKVSYCSVSTSGLKIKQKQPPRPLRMEMSLLPEAPKTPKAPGPQGPRLHSQRGF